MAAEIVLRVKVDKSQYKAFKEEVKKGIDTGGQNATADSLKKVGDQAQASTSKIQSLGEMLTKKIAWYSISMAISSVTTAFKDALNEIKEVDTQLTNIAKVSNASAEQLQALSDKAYSTASKYGVEASKYMEAVYEYTKAGFQDNADVMAELSTKAMLVGDTTASIADKFLIAGNAAWNYGKNVEELSLLVDKADYINNNYATTFDKIAEGFPRVANVAAMAGMSAEETMAALGTITATTQETASRASTALRALIINILGDTNTEIEDGVTATQEQIESLTDALRKYAPEVVKAAEATGSLINPMEAVKALSEAYKKGDLTQAGLYEIESALGGKLRTNQLDALLKQFDDTYMSMMDGMAGAYGTADKEIETMLGSWESKTQILKNTWTEFIAKGLNADTFKGAIDWVTQLVDRFDGLNEILPIVVGSMTALFAPAIVGNIAKAVKNLGNLKTAIHDIKNGIKGKDLDISGAIGTGISLIATAVTTAIALYQNYVRKIRQESQAATDEALNAAKTSEGEFDNLTSLYSEYNKAKSAYENGTGSKEAYRTATENLVVALGYEKTAVDALEGSLESLTEQQLQNKLQDINNAVDVAERNIITQGNTYRGFTENEIIKATQKRQSTGVTDYNGDEIMEEVAFEERIKRSVEAYKNYQSRLKALSAAYSAESISDLNKAIVAGDVGYSEGINASALFKNLSKDQITEEINKIQGFLEEAEFVGSYLEAIEAQEKYNKAVEDFGKDSEEATQAAEEVATAEKNLAVAAENAAAAQKKVADAFSEINGTAKTATEALDKYKKALEGDTAESDADALVEAAKKAVEAYEKGLKDSTEITAFADLFLGAEQIAKIREAGGNVADALMSNENFRRIFIQGTDEEGNTVFNDAIEASKQLAGILKEFDTDSNSKLTDNTGNDIWARLYETSEGTKIIVEDWEALSKQFGMTKESLQILLNMYGKLIPGLEASTQDMINFADACKAFYETGEGIKRIDLGRVIQKAFEQGATQDQVHSLVESLMQMQENGDVELVVDDQQVRFADESTQTLISSLDETTYTRIIRIDQSDVEDAQTKIAGLRSAIEGLENTNPIIKLNMVYGVPTLPDIIEKGVMGSNASGTDSAAGGATLVNEEGAEIIQSNGKAWIAGGGYPTVTNIPKGAKVWTADETKDILKNSRLNLLYGGIKAMAGGSSVPSAISSVALNTLWEGANLFADTSEDNTLKGLQGMVSLRKAELTLIEQSEDSIDKQVEKQKEIQSAIVDVVKRLQETGGRQEDIVQLAAEWYQIESNIKELQDTESEKQKEHLEELESQTSLLESQLSLLEAKDSSVKKQILKEREIKNSIQAQINYLKKIGGSQEEINKLKAKQYDIDKNIVSLEKSLYDNLQKAINGRIDDLNEKRDKELSKIDKKIEKLQKAHDIQKETNELKEKELAVEKAQEALANAKAQRTVRIYNAAKKRWEWTYDASAVNSAKEELSSARQSLKDYNSEKAYESRIAALEAKQDKINANYDARIEKWQKVLDSMEEPVQSIKSAIKSIEKNATEQMLPTLKKINRALKATGKSIGVKNLYDSGGLLTGLGGIKGTTADEIVLPPDITSRMLKPAMTSQLAQRMNELRYIYGSTGNLAGSSSMAIGSQHNGDIYTFGNITLNKEQAKSTTVYELAKMARGLRSYSSAM